MSKQFQEPVICSDHIGECFARRKAYMSEIDICSILTDSKFSGHCPFKKPKRELTEDREKSNE